MKKIVRYVCIMLTLVLCMVQTPSVMASKKTTSSSLPKGPKAASLAAGSAILMEASTGLILYEKNIDKREYPASITKIMTALVALENSSLDEVITYSKNAVYGIEYGSSNIAIEAGEKLTMEQSLYAIMLESANEACLGVAEHIAGSVEGFVDMMNKKAKELGCTNTHFVNPNGLHDDDHYVSAHDMALIAKAAIQNETFRKITSTKHYTIPKTNKKVERNWIKNHHQMLNGYKYPKYQYDYCIGGKTGYTTKAQNTLVTFAEKDGMTLISVVLKDYGPYYEKNEYTDSTALLNFGFDNFSLHSVKNAASTNSTGDYLFSQYSGLLNEENPLIYIDPATNVILPKGVTMDEVEQTPTFVDVKNYQEGENVIGTVSYSYNGIPVGTGNIIYNVQDINQLVTQTQVDANTAVQPLNSPANGIANKIAFIVAAVIVGLGLIYYVYIVQKRKRQSAYYRKRRQSYYDHDDYL
ncbi:MAG: D-alanyl-D-alanine carboxypeptidase [Clostridium sp.]|nr:D-alanyl-D-alanine carboxypeptidase [Clostridium sp.]